MKKILLLGTGGTIASEAGASGFVPGIKSESLLQSAIGELYPGCTFQAEDILSLDSSNIQPEHWLIIARRVFESLCEFDGVIILHGTDTMAYTAVALSFMLRNLDKSVVLTGSQVPFGEPGSDAVANIRTAIAAVRAGITGVSVAFAGRVICGTRAVKVSTMDYSAFESVNAPYMAQMMADGLRVFSNHTAPSALQLPLSLDDRLCTDVFLLKLVPGTKPELFDSLISLGYRGVVIEAFGAGGIHYEIRDLPAKLKVMADLGIPVVVCSQCLYERADLSIYEVGRQMLASGVIPAGDMTTEAAVVKLMWALGRTKDILEVARIFEECYAGEVSL